MIYKINSTQYDAIKFSNKKHPMSHEDIINYLNKQLSHTVIEQRSVTLQHNNGSMAHVHFKPIRAITEVLII